MTIVLPVLKCRILSWPTLLLFDSDLMSPIFEAEGSMIIASHQVYNYP
jgi:hypothetical protein